MLYWLRSPCGTASLASCKTISYTHNLAPVVPRLPLRKGALHRPGYTYKLFPSSRREAKTLVRAGRDVLLRGVPSEYKDDVARVVEKAERAAETSWTTIHTGQTLTHQALSGHGSGTLQGTTLHKLIKKLGSRTCRLLHTPCCVPCHAGHPAAGKCESCALWGLQPGRAAEDHHGPARAC